MNFCLSGFFGKKILSVSALQLGTYEEYQFAV